MTRVVYATATTLDGFLATSDDSLDWLFAVPGAAEAEQEIDGFLAGVGAVVMGATTYSWVLDHERLTEHPERWTDVYGARPVWVFTHRDLPVPAGADVRLVEGDVRDHLSRIIGSCGGRDLWLVGGGDLVGQFADVGHLDEVRVSVAPVTLGAGRPLLPRALDSSRLRLDSVERQGQFAELRYSVNRR